MTIKTILIIAMLLLSLPSAVDAKPVIVGYNGNFNPAILEEYNISNYTIHQQIDAFSADISESTMENLSTAGNYGGKLGKYQFHLKDII